MSAPIGTCLQCGETRESVKANQYICGIMSGYEEPELEHEFLRHRWADWSDQALKEMGIKPTSYGKYRRSNIGDFQWADCDDTIRGHNIAKEAFEEWIAGGECWNCGKKPEAQ